MRWHKYLFNGFYREHKVELGHIFYSKLKIDEDDKIIEEILMARKNENSIK